MTAWWSGSSTAPPLDPQVQQQWKSMKPSCQCARNHMFLQAQEPGASDLAWGRGVPQSCGYRVNQDSAHGLQLTVPYDGCRIVALVMLKVPQTWRQCDWPFTGIYRPITLYLVVDYVPTPPMFPLSHFEIPCSTLL